MLTRTLLLLALLLPLGRAEAMPALFFDGAIRYTQATGAVVVEGDIALTQELPLPTLLPGSRFLLNARFASLTPGPVLIAALDPAPDRPGVLVADIDGTTLLTGDLTAAELAGPAGWDFGRLMGEITPTGGTVAAEFTAPSPLFALSLNLTTPFSAQMFDADFSGRVNGRIITLATTSQAVNAVPEPTTALLFSAGLFLLFVATRSRGFPMLRALLLVALLLPAGRATGAILPYPHLLFGDLDAATGMTFIHDPAAPWLPATGMQIEAHTFRIDYADAHILNLPWSPFLLTADAAGANGTLTIGAGGSELTATVSNGVISTFYDGTPFLYAADLTYTGGTYAAGLAGGQLEVILTDWRSSDGLIHVGGNLGAINDAAAVAAASVPEPTSLLLLGSCALLLLARRHRR